MSRIFDALQRAESERSGTDVGTLPQGPELLEFAERQAATEWKRDGGVSGSDGSGVVIDTQTPDPTRILADSGTVADLGRSTLLDRFPSTRISLSAQSRLVSLTDRESPTAEAIRLLGVRLKDLRRSRPLKKLLITSTIPQEGKSTIAANLACTLSRATEERTLLLEGDLRRPSLSRIFGIQRVPGICEYLRDEGASLSGIYHLEDAGPWILPAGNAPSNPLELLQSPRLGVLMEQLSTLFDWIVVDSPPVLPLADTSVWMRVADGILLVTRQGTTEKQQLKKGLDALDSSKVLGAIMNGSIASAYSGYYYRATS